MVSGIICFAKIVGLIYSFFIALMFLRFYISVLRRWDHQPEPTIKTLSLDGFLAVHYHDTLIVAVHALTIQVVEDAVGWSRNLALSLRDASSHAVDHQRHNPTRN